MHRILLNSRIAPPKSSKATAASASASDAKDDSKAATNTDNSNTGEKASEFTLTGGLSFLYKKEEATEIFTSKFSHTDEYVMVGMGDGKIQVYHVETGEAVRLLYEPTFAKTPCTNISLRPNATNNAQTANVLAATYADGKLRHWHLLTGEKLSEIDESRYIKGTAQIAPASSNQQENQTLTVDYYRDGTTFATAGSDCTVRLYDEQTRKCTTAMVTGNAVAGAAGHSNRIFCVKFHPLDRNLLISSGWDNTVQMWDVRANTSIRSVYGPHICGEAADFDETGERFLTGSYDKKNQLQVWSFKDAALLETIPWTIMEDRKPCLLYSASFSRPHPAPTSSNANTNSYIVAGGDIANEVKVFRADSRKCIGVLTGMQNAVYTTCMNRAHTRVLVAGGNKAAYMLKLRDHEDQAELIY